MESYAHKAAKSVVAGWLRECAANSDDFAEFCGIRWRVNRLGPLYGVWEEYPVVDCDIGAWDEVDEQWSCAPPTYRQMIDSGCRPAAILDVAIQHKGQITTAIEIHHRHALTKTKIGVLAQTALSGLIEMPAKWVLAHIKPPSTIPAKFWRIGRPL